MLRSRLLELSSLTQPVHSLVNTVRYTITIYVESGHFSPLPLLPLLSSIISHLGESHGLLTGLVL